MIRRILVMAMMLAIGLTALPAAAQYDYDDDAEYEYEPGEGLHEEEWYDPSDWFNDDGMIDYEYDDYYGYTDDVYDDDLYYEPYDYYGYGSYYDPYTDTYEYGMYGDVYDNDGYGYGYGYDLYDDFGYSPYDYDYDVYSYDVYGGDYGSSGDTGQYGSKAGQYRDTNQYGSANQYGNNRNANRYGRGNPFGNTMARDFDEEFTGTVIALRSLHPRGGHPATVQMKIRTDDGNVRTLKLGDRTYVRSNLPQLSKGTKVTIRGNRVQRDGQPMFKARQVVVRGQRLDLPRYTYGKTLTGTLTNVRTVRVSEDGNVRAVVATLRAPNGRQTKVLLGSPQKLQQKAQFQNVQLQPGTKVKVKGYTRTVDGASTFHVQQIQTLQQSDRQGRFQQQQEAQRQRTYHY